MRPYFALLCALCALLFTTTAARAEDSPPPAPAGQQPAPAPDKSSDSAPKVTARKEDEDEAAQRAAHAKQREGFFAGFFGSGKKAALGERDEALAENEKLTARIAELEKQNATLQKQIAYIDQNWPAIEAALTQGNANDPALQSDLGKKVAVLTMKTAAAQVHNATGHDPKNLPGPGATKPEGKPAADADKKPTAAQLIQLGLQQHREKQSQN